MFVKAARNQACVTNRKVAVQHTVTCSEVSKEQMGNFAFDSPKPEKRKQFRKRLQT